MTEISRWLIGLVCISGLHAVWYLAWTLWGQYQSGTMTWRDSAPMRLALSMIMLAVALGGFAFAAAVSPTTEPKGTGTYIIWCSWSVVWLSALVALSGLRAKAVEPNLVICALWSLGMAIRLGVML